MKKKRKNTTHKILAYLLALSMTLTLVPTTVFAEEATNTTTEYEMENVEFVEEAELEEEVEAEEEIETVEVSAEDGTMSLVDQAELSPSTGGISLFSVTPTIGTDESNPFYIGNADILEELAELVNSSATYGSYSYADAYYVVVDDIDVSYMDWEPIGTDTNSFNGTFDGSDDIITIGVNDYDDSKMANGLFGETGEDAIISVTVVCATSSWTDVATEFVVSDNAYTITTAGELAYLAQQVNAGTTYCGVSFKLGNDIDLSDYEWVAIGTYYNKFAGTFDGDGKTIYGLYINQPDSSSQGLFGYTSGGTIQNVNVEGDITGKQSVGGIVGNKSGTVTNCSFSGSITGNGSYTGGIVGYNSGSVTNCSVSGSVSGTGNVGGVVGYNNYATITTCHNTADVTSTGDAGGVVGYSVEGTVSDCSNTGDVSGAGNVGGVVGESSSGTSGATVTNCHNTGDVSSTGTYVGGVVGQNKGDSAAATVAYCSNTGNVSSGGDSVGGVVGYSYYNAPVTYCYNTGDVSGTGGNNIGGVVGKTSAWRSYSVSHCYNIGDVSGTGSEMGGIVGYVYGQTDKSIVSNCVALCELISGTSDVGRVVGAAAYSSHPSASYSLENNYAWDSMTVNGALVTSDLGTGTNSGEDLTYDSETKALTGVDSWDDIFGTVEGWGSAMSALPNGDDLPSYITGDVVIEITTAEELAKIGTEDDYPLRGSYILMDNLDLEDTVWASIETFTGTFDGNDFEIYGLTISGDNNTGLFSYNTGTIKNLTVSGEVYGSNYTGGIVGYNKGTVENCTNNVSVEGSSYVGGVVGYNYGGTVENCTNNGTVTGESSYVGGIVGTNYIHAYSSSTATVSNCYNNGVVKSYEGLVGGIVGYNFADSADYGTASVSNCYNTGAVSGTDDNVGGVVGYNCVSSWSNVSVAATVSNCYNTGDVNGGGNNVGGVVGYNYAYNDNGHTGIVAIISVSNCYNTGNVTGTSYVGGVVGYNYMAKNYYSGAAYATVSNCVSLGNSVTGDNYVGRVIGDSGSSGGATVTLSNNYAYSGMTAENATLTTATKVTTGIDGADLTYDSETDSFSATDVSSWSDIFGEDSTWTGDMSALPNEDKLPVYITGNTKIYTVDDLKNIVNDLSGTYILMNDLDLGGSAENTWSPIGSSETPFTGTFEGSGFEIYGLYIDTDENYQGLFGYVSDGTIQNVTVSGEVNGGSYVGGIVGYLADGTVENCSFSGSLTATGDYVGGIVGYIGVDSNVTVNESYNTGVISGSGDNIGGVVGYIYLNNSATVNVTNCYNDGRVSSTGSNQLGGVIGGIYSLASVSNTNTYVTNCYNLGEIVSTSTEDVGGIVGECYIFTGNVYIRNCYNTGEVNGGYKTAGISGYNYTQSAGKITIENCYNTGDISSAGNTVGGIVAHFYGNGNMTLTNCYNTGSVTGAKYVGGVLAYNAAFGGVTATISNCVSLGNTVSGTSYVGRVIGYYGGENSLNNYAWSGMTATNATLDETTKVANGLDGADLYYSSDSGFYTDSALTTAFGWISNVSFGSAWTIPTTTYELPNLMGEISQNPLANLEFYTVTFVYDSSTTKTASVEAGYAVAAPTDVVDIDGYSYAWTYTYTDADSKEVTAEFDFGTKITDDLTLTLAWTLDAPAVTVGDLTTTYTGEAQNITATASHDATVTFSYAWYKETETSGTYAETTSSETAILAVTDVADSGTYKVVVTATVDDYTATAEQEVTVEIQNATMTDTTTKTQSAVYTNSELTPSVASATTVDGTTPTVKYQDDNGEYTLDVIPSFTDSDVYTVYYEITADNHNAIQDSLEYTIGQSTVTFDDFEGTSTMKAYDNTTGAEQYAFTYGDTIQVVVTPEVTGEAVATLSSYEEQSANSMALYIGDTQITEPKEVTTGMELTFTIDTTAKQLATGDNEITAKYVGNDNMASYSDSITVTLAKKALTATVATDTAETSITKVYDGDAEFEDVALVLVTDADDSTTANKLASDDEITATAGGTRASVNVTGDDTFTASAITLSGDDASFYSLDVDDVTGSVEVTTKTVTNSDITITLEDGFNYVYTGDAKEPSVTIKDNDLNAIIAASEYSVEYSDKINVGLANITVTDAEDGNYNITGDTTFGITQADAQILSDIALSQRYTVTTEQTQSVAGLMPEDAGTLSYAVGRANTGDTGITADFSVDSESGLVTYSLADGSSLDVGKIVYLPITISSTNYEDSTVQLAIEILRKASSSSSCYIKVTATGNGTIDPDGGADYMYEVSKYDDVTFEFDADSGYEVTDVIVNGKSVGACDEYEFENIIDTVQTLEVVFEKKSSSSEDEDDEDVEVEEVEAIELPFVDIDEDNDNYDGIAYVYEEGIMAGISSDVFGSELSITRAMIAAILYRINGSEAIEGEMPFGDVSADQYYYDAVVWGKAEGVMAGVSETEFAPNTAITIEQFIAFLYRYASALGMDMTVEYDTDLSGYVINDYAITAIAWALENDIIDEDDLNPAAEALRGDVATALMNFMEMM